MKKYLNSLLAIIIPFLLLILIITTLSYFNLLSPAVTNYMKMIIPVISMIIGGIYIGRKSMKKGWLEGLKIGGIFLILLFLFSYLGFQKNFELKNIIYYIILLISSMLGSMIGINKKEKK